MVKKQSLIDRRVMKKPTWRIKKNRRIFKNVLGKEMFWKKMYGIMRLEKRRKNFSIISSWMSILLRKRKSFKEKMWFCRKRRILLQWICKKMSLLGKRKHFKIGYINYRRIIRGRKRRLIYLRSKWRILLCKIRKNFQGFKKKLNN